MSTLSVEDHALATEIAAEIIDEAELFAIGAWQLRPIVGDAKVIRRNARGLAQDRLARIQAHVEGS